MNIPEKKVYSWAGYCRFKVNDDNEDEDEYEKQEDYENQYSEETHENELSQNEPQSNKNKSNSYNQSQLENDQRLSKLPLDLQSNLFKSKKPNFDESSPRLAITKSTNLVQPLKQVYVYLRNDNILERVRVKNPKYVHLHSHPLGKISQEAAKKLGRFKSLKPLSLRNYGYDIREPVNYSQKGIDMEEANNGGFEGEDYLGKELDYFIRNTVTLGKLDIMLSCPNGMMFKVLQKYAKRQKRLREFGFILESYHCNLWPLHTNLTKLEIRSDDSTYMKIKGFDKLNNLTSFICGTTCGTFPAEQNFEEEEEEDEYIFEDDPITLGPKHLSLVSQATTNPKLKAIKIRNFEIGYNCEFWEGLINLLRDRSDLKITYEILFYREGYDDEFIGYLDALVLGTKLSGKARLIIVDLGSVKERCVFGGGLRAESFNFDKQYLYEVRTGEVDLILPNR